MPYVPEDLGRVNSGMRVVFDTMVYDKWALDPNAKAAIDDAIADGRIRIVETHIQEEQIAAIPNDNEHRHRDAVLALVKRQGTESTSTAGFVWDVSPWGKADWPDDFLVEFYQCVLGNTKAGRVGHIYDALLATTALAKADVFVTEEPGLRNRIRGCVAELKQSLKVLSLKDLLKVLPDSIQPA
jgi:hypothetical protein